MAISKVIYKANANATPVVWMDVTDDTVDTGNLLTGYQATGADGEKVTGSYTPTPAGYLVTIDDHTADENNPVTINGIVDQGHYSGTVLFTVSCSKPCAVGVTTNGGLTYTRLYAITMGAANTYLFSVNVNQAMTIAVVYKGDANDDGEVNNKDVTRIGTYVSNPGGVEIMPLAADVDADGDIDLDDQATVMEFVKYDTGINWDGAAPIYQVSVDNRATGENYPATIAGIVNQGYYNGTVLFTVSCSKACVVLYTTDGGTTYTRLYAVATGTANTYLFSVNVAQAMTIIVNVKGDVDSDGKLDITDRVQSRAFVNGQITLTDLQQMFVDVNADGTVDSTDADLVQAAASNTTPLDWDIAS